jgi:hypothetical protein
MRASATFESRTCQIEDQPAASVEQIADKQFECVSFWTDGGGSREVQDHDIRFDFRGRHAKGHDGIPARGGMNIAGSYALIVGGFGQGGWTISC